MVNRITEYWPIHEECDLTSPDRDVYEQYESQIHEEVARMQIAPHDEIQVAKKREWLRVQMLIDQGVDPAIACEKARDATGIDIQCIRLFVRRKIDAQLGMLRPPKCAKKPL